MQELEGVIYGKVYGVGFRMFLKKKADELDLRGWTSNTPEGRVAFVVQGERKKLEKFLEHAEKGPPFSRVDGVDVEWYDRTQDTFTDFSIEAHED